MSEQTDSRETTALGLEHRESKYPVSRLSAKFGPNLIKKESSGEELRIYASAMSQLEIIAEQIRTLQERAQEIIDHAELDMHLHRVTCKFEKRIGIAYHLYESANAGEYFSMISPDEWGTPPHRFIGSYVLGGDGSWKRM